LGHVLRGKFNDLCHRREGCRMSVPSGPKKLDDVVLRPIFQAAIAAAADARCRPVLQLAALQVLILLVRSGEILRRVAAGAVAWALHKVGSTIPLRTLVRIFLKLAGLEKHPLPAQKRKSLVEREGELVFRLLASGMGNSGEI